MKTKSLIWAFCILAALSLVGVAAVSAQGGGATLTLINFVGAEMVFTLEGTTYTVPGVDTAPGGGQLALALAPGRYTYSAHIPGRAGSNGALELAVGQTQVWGARLERSQPIISPAGIVLEEPQDVLVFFEASLTPPVPAAAPLPAPLQALPAGQGALVLVNTIGEALTVDIDGLLYTVPANGRLQVNLPPGEFSYSASAGLSGTNGVARVRAGEYTGLGFTREIPPEEPDYQLGELAPTPVPLNMSVFPVSLDDEPLQAAPAPSAAASPIPEAPPAPVPSGQGELAVVNYIGETLTFTIDNQAYSVAGAGGKLTLHLAPGDYTFTASTPRAAANRGLRIPGGAATQVSVALDLRTGQIELYIE